MTTATATARTIDELRRDAYDKRGGRVTDADLPAIVAANRLEPMLIRWSTGRAIVPAQGVADLIEILNNVEILDNAGGRVYVRDVHFFEQYTTATAHTAGRKATR